jgi:Secretion system C-terminal sorting domain
MRTLLFVFLCFLGVTALAQSPITITQNDMPEPGDTLRVSITDAQGVDIVQTGSNQLWDYRNLVPLRQDRTDYVYSFLTIYAFYFLGVNQYGTKVSDTIGGGPFQFTQVYNFFRSASQDFRAEGVGFRYSGVPLAAYYTDEDELYQFPLNYNDRDSTTFRFSVDLGNGLRFSEEGYRINEVDGWGTVMTPYDSIACLRLVSTTNAIDTIVFNGFPFATPNQQISIKFLANGVHIPILEITGRVQMGQYLPQQVKYRDRYQNLVTVDMPQADAIEVYPNPVSDVLRISNDADQGLEATLIDVQGKVVATQSIGLGLQQLAVAHLPVGVYMLTLRTAQGELVKASKILIQD